MDEKLKAKTYKNDSSFLNGGRGGGSQIFKIFFALGGKVALTP